MSKNNSTKKRSCHQTDPRYPELKSAVERLLAQDIEPTYRSITERFPDFAKEFLKGSLSNQITRIKKSLRNANPVLNNSMGGKKKGEFIYYFSRFDSGCK
jgi:hypothetical protein